jgi:hypothetical protein
VDFLGNLLGQAESSGSILYVGYGEIYLVGFFDIGEDLRNRPSSGPPHYVCDKEDVQITFP